MLQHILQTVNTEQGLRVAFFFCGLCGAVLGAVFSVFLFFWKESRERYQKQMAACRSLVMFITYILEHVSHEALSDIDVRLETILVNSDMLMREHSALLIMNELVSLMEEIRHRASSNSEGRIQDIVQRLERLKGKAQGNLKSKMDSCKGWILLSR